MKKHKILEKVLAGSKNVRFDEFVTLLEDFGFELKRTRGSHHHTSEDSQAFSYTAERKAGETVSGAPTFSSGRAV